MAVERYSRPVLYFVQRDGAHFMYDNLELVARANLRRALACRRGGVHAHGFNKHFVNASGRVDLGSLAI